MPRFDYRVRDKEGQAITGAIEAPTSEIAMETLRDRGFFVVSLEEAKKAGVFEFELPFFNKIPIKDIVIFSRQFSVLMGAAVPLVQSLQTVARQTKNPRLHKILLEVADEVEAGTALSGALERHPNAFSEFFVHMVRSGETTGRLEEIMNYLADQMEKDYDLNQRIRGAMIYPIFILIGLVIVGFVMMAFVIPKLTEVLSQSGTDLPWTTELLIVTSGFFKVYAIHIIVAAFLAIGGFKWWTSTKTGRYIWDKYKLYLPIFGNILKMIYVVRFTQSFGTMITGGVDIPSGLQISSDVVGNAYYREQLMETKREVSDGNPLTSVFVRERSMPDMVPQMISVGEETGRLAEVLAKLTDFYTRELSHAVSNLVHAIEPLIMMVMGVAVGVMVAAILLPMYNMATQF
ncbi:MAG: type II secretion system F family protein [Patescibacteria group bacterium]|nr:type II secretion system F family protein [Patescibacteria group bacterium]